MNNPSLEKWRPAVLALAAPMERLPTPIHVLTGEAVDIARVWEHHWAAERDGSGRVTQPGFELAVREPTNAQKAALDLRNRIATLLYGRMNQVRNAARLCFVVSRRSSRR